MLKRLIVCHRFSTKPTGQQKAYRGKAAQREKQEPRLDLFSCTDLGFWQLTFPGAMPYRVRIRFSVLPKSPGHQVPSSSFLWWVWNTAHGSCLCCNGRGDIWACITHDCPPLTLQHRLLHPCLQPLPNPRSLLATSFSKSPHAWSRSDVIHQQLQSETAQSSLRWKVFSFFHYIHSAN